MIRLVIFDLDGVIVDSRDSIVELYTRTFRAFHLPPPSPADILRVSSLGSTGILKALLPPSHAQDTTLFQKMKEHIAVLGADREIINLIKLNNEMIEFIRFLREKKYHTAIATNRGKSTSIVLRHFGILNLFELVVTATDCQYLKPHPECLNKVLAGFSLSPQEAIYIGDSATDLEAGMSAHIHTFLYPAASIQDITQHLLMYGGRS